MLLAHCNGKRWIHTHPKQRLSTKRAENQIKVRQLMRTLKKKPEGTIYVGTIELKQIVWNLLCLIETKQRRKKFLKWSCCCWITDVMSIQIVEKAKLQRPSPLTPASVLLRLLFQYFLSDFC